MLECKRQLVVVVKKRQRGGAKLLVVKDEETEAPFCEADDDLIRQRLRLNRRSLCVIFIIFCVESFSGFSDENALDKAHIHVNNNNGSNAGVAEDCDHHHRETRQRVALRRRRVRFIGHGV